jgi:FMN reductase
VVTKLVGILGSVTPPGRLHRAVTEALGRATDADATLIDLATERVSFADGREPSEYGDDTESVIATVAASDAVLLASPVYRGTYTGALKNLLDLLPVDVLRSKPVGIVAMGYTLHHYLGVEHQLRAVLSWFGALTAPNAVYLTVRDFVEDGVAPEAAASLDELLGTLIGIAQATSRLGLGPAPLASRHT